MPTPNPSDEVWTDSRNTRLHGMGRLMARIGRYLTHSPLGILARRRLRGQLEERHTYVELPSRAGSGRGRLPRVAFLSDLHAGFFNTPRDLDRLARRVAAFDPELVFLGGDLIDSHGEEVFLLGMALRRMKPRLGIFAVRGNHEYFHPEELGLWTRFLEHSGVQVLVNRGVRVSFEGTNLWIAGIDDWREGQPDLGAALEGRRPDDVTLLVSHNPDAFPEAVDHGVDLQFSGHTHGGQVRFGSWVPATHSRLGYYDGLYESGGSQLYVGRGGGTTLLPIRIGARPEVGLLELAYAPVREELNPRPEEARPASTDAPVRAPLPTRSDPGARDRSTTERSRRS